MANNRRIKERRASVGPEPRGPRGARGKRGQRGERGEQGPTGPRGKTGPAVSSDVIRSVGEIREQLESVAKDLQTQFKRIAEMQAQLDHLTGMLSVLPKAGDR